MLDIININKRCAELYKVGDIWRSTCKQNDEDHYTFYIFDYKKGYELKPSYQDSFKSKEDMYYIYIIDKSHCNRNLFKDLLVYQFSSLSMMSDYKNRIEVKIA